VTARLGLAVAATAALVAVAAPPARADGDPASDVLLYQKVFVPYYGKTSKPSVAELKRVVAAAARRGLPVRVALIGSRYDLGSVSVLYLKPKTYASFLGKELALTGVYRGPVLVVMPNGFGFSKDGVSQRAELAVLAGVPTAKAKGEDVATAALRAVRKLAAAKGVHLAVTIPKAAPPAASSSGGSKGPSRMEVGGFIAVVLLVVAALETARRLRGRRREAV
jgi:hypothetical protein